MVRVPVDRETGEPAAEVETLFRLAQGGGLDLEAGRLLVQHPTGEEPRPATLVVVENWTRLLE